MYDLTLGPGTGTPLFLRYSPCRIMYTRMFKLFPSCDIISLQPYSEYNKSGEYDDAG
jgi:hypothetical protein